MINIKTSVLMNNIYFLLFPNIRNEVGENLLSSLLEMFLDDLIQAIVFFFNLLLNFFLFLACWSSQNRCNKTFAI